MRQPQPINNSIAMTIVISLLVVGSIVGSMVVGDVEPGFLLKTVGIIFAIEILVLVFLIRRMQRKKDF